MHESDGTPRFLAVLVYEDDEGRVWKEPHVYASSHPEIAYQLARVTGDEQRYGRTFVGLARLEQFDGDVELAGHSQQGAADDVVQPKMHLTVFRDRRWLNVPHDEDELTEALAEPEYLMDIPGLREIPWYRLTHASGLATDVPKNLQRLTSASGSHRKRALWNLFGTIHHQGTLYSATSVAVPFILQILENASLPDRGGTADLLEALAESATSDLSKIEDAWRWRSETFGEIYERNSREMAAAEVAAFTSVLQCFVDNLTRISRLAEDDDVDVARHARATVDLVLNRTAA